MKIGGNYCINFFIFLGKSFNKKGNNMEGMINALIAEAFLIMFIIGAILIF